MFIWFYLFQQNFYIYLYTYIYIHAYRTYIYMYNVYIYMYNVYRYRYMYMHIYINIYICVFVSLFVCWATLMSCCWCQTVRTMALRPWPGQLGVATVSRISLRHVHFPNRKFTIGESIPGIIIEVTLAHPRLEFRWATGRGWADQELWRLWRSAESSCFKSRENRGGLIDPSRFHRGRKRECFSWNQKMDDIINLDTYGKQHSYRNSME